MSAATAAGNRRTRQPDGGVPSSLAGGEEAMEKSDDAIEADAYDLLELLPADPVEAEATLDMVRRTARKSINEQGKA